MPTTQHVLLTIYTPAGLQQAGATPPLPYTANLQEIYINAHQGSHQIRLLLGHTEGEGYPNLNDYTLTTPLFSHLSALTQDTAPYLRLIHPEIHLTQLNYEIPLGHRITYHCINDTTSTDAYINIILTLSVNSE